MKKGIAVCFPGTGYTCRETLFTLCAESYQARGYDVIKLDYSHIPFQEIETFEEAVGIALRASKRQLSGADFSEYRDVVWISKSLGTICAAVAEKESGVSPRHLLLTPVEATLELLKPGARVTAMVLGTTDRFLSSKKLAEFCAEHGYRYCVINGVGHNLKDENDPKRTERINEQIVGLCD
jgi:phosphoglycolate phosphatase